MLTQKALDNLRPGPTRREVPDGRGLFFVLQPSGAASWALRYRVNGRARKFTIGPWPAVGLKAAREKANAALVDIANGRDPCAEKIASRRTARGSPMDTTSSRKSSTLSFQIMLDAR